jgi:dTDP-4-dehydrorhamnose 3,5-epimerase
LFRPLEIEGAYSFEPKVWTDGRGHFFEGYKESLLHKHGVEFTVRQSNSSTSAKGVIRGVHFTESPPGQAKFINCVLGEIWDVVVDLRRSSRTFGKWQGINLLGGSGAGVFIGPGLGHAFLSLQEGSVVSYLSSTEYSPEIEHQINPFDEALAIDFQAAAEARNISSFTLSDKDRTAQSLQTAKIIGILPN